MKINSDLLIDSKINGNIYAENIKCKNLVDISESIQRSNYHGLSCLLSDNGEYMILNGSLDSEVSYLDIYICSSSVNPKTRDYINTNPGYYTISNNLGLESYFALSTGGYPKNTTFINGNLSSSFVRIYRGHTYNNDILKIQLEIGTNATEWTKFVDFENNYTKRDLQQYKNEGISWNKAVTYSNAADIPAWYSLITMNLIPKKTGTYLFNYSIPVLAMAGGTPFLDVHIDEINKYRAYISNVNSYTNMTPAAITGSFIISGLSLNTSHPVDIGISKNNAIGYRVSAAYPITVTALEI